jgi:argininosuccinate synthase
MKGSYRKVVLAYSGGLDTSVMVKWLIENYGCEVVTYSANLGQDEDLDAIREKALSCGAVKAIVEDLQEEFAAEYVLPALKANAIYEGKYPLATALGRPLIAARLVEIARAEGADAVAHGSTGKGNDQVRFDVSVMALDPDLAVLAPVRTWEFKSREEEIEYAQKHAIAVPVTKEKPYSLDKNLWGISIECGVLEDPWAEPPKDIYSMTIPPALAPDKPTHVEIGFEAGRPIELNGRPMGLVELIKELNIIAGRNGIGLVDLVENRLVGIKSREVYEAPAGTVLHTAHRELEHLVLDRETFHYKQGVALKYAELVYFGLWFSPLREALDAFVQSTQRTVTGTVRLMLYKGNCVPIGRRSPYSLYDLELATYEAADTFDHKTGEAFCKVWGLPLKVRARVMGRNKGPSAG